MIALEVSRKCDRLLQLQNQIEQLNWAFDCQCDRCLKLDDKRLKTAKNQQKLT
ncbi:hypothetical protein [Nostoc sp. CMAA1605]|uniref:hypothetical protein n=1 Tax=Nostoc sp. CMAA1605 TaxID=2055159 RepID=UPI001F1CA5A2|nr:hypothetical protein [Nostoc sp. CMAA1605]